jgi:hypothetical protein
MKTKMVEDAEMLRHILLEKYFEVLTCYDGTGSINGLPTQE